MGHSSGADYASNAIEWGGVAKRKLKNGSKEVRGKVFQGKKA